MATFKPRQFASTDTFAARSDLEALARSATSRRATLVAILAVAAFLRLWGLEGAPPGLNQDEAVNAWNAWCLLHTGLDQCGQRWPLFFSHTIGDNRSTLFFYLLMPFQAVGGLGVWTTRLPMAAAGVVSVALTDWIARRWFDRATGIVAAGMLAVNPWHLQLSRWANEGSLTAFAAISATAAFTWALGLGRGSGDRGPSSANRARTRGLGNGATSTMKNSVPGGEPDRADGDTPWGEAPMLCSSIIRASCAGGIAGVWCYGYPAIRIFMPLCLLAMIGIGRFSVERRRRFLKLALAACGGFSLFFAPLAWQHVTRPEEIGLRASARWAWSSEDTPIEKAAKVASRYPAHFSPGFLFLRGDEYEVSWASGFGVFPPYSSVLMLAGLWVCVTGVRREHGNRLLLAWLILYPAGDVANSHLSAHILRGATGVGPLTILAAVGAVEGFRRLSSRRLMATRITVLAVSGALAVEQHGRFFLHYFGARNVEPGVYHGFHADLTEACAWLRPRLPEYEHTVVTNTDMNVPYIIALVKWRIDPEEWFRAEKEFRTVGEWEFCTRFGGHHFPLEPVSEYLHNLERSGGRTIAIVARPGETPLGRIVKQVRDSRGEVMVEIREWR